MIRRDPLFKGCTRPAMLFGVPLTPLAVVVGGFTLLAVWVSLLVLLLLPPLVLTMRAIAEHDDQQFRLLWLRFQFRFRMRNRRFWSAASYSPMPFRSIPVSLAPPRLADDGRARGLALSQEPQ